MQFSNVFRMVCFCVLFFFSFFSNSEENSNVCGGLYSSNLFINNFKAFVFELSQFFCSSYYDFKQTN